MILQQIIFVLKMRSTIDEIEIEINKSKMEVYLLA
jgi:hypothetical protein